MNTADAKNKATEGHLGHHQSQALEITGELLQDQARERRRRRGLRRAAVGRGRLRSSGFPSVGKSSLLSTLTATQSEARRGMNLPH